MTTKKNTLNDLFLVTESPVVASIPKRVKKLSKDRIRMDCILQTSDTVNNNKRRYPKGLLEGGINMIGDRLTEGALYGELDHPITDNPTRHMSVLYKEASHRILETGWDGNKLIGVVETLRTPNGMIIKNLGEDGMPVGFSLRAVGSNIKQVNEGGQVISEVMPPIKIVTWDSVANPSHREAKMLRIKESSMNALLESVRLEFEEFEITENSNGTICTKDGICYTSNDFDQLVEQRVITLKKKFGW